VKKGLVAFVAGLLFSAGLVLSGMTQPSKVVGFLDFGGVWDPSLAFVMAGGIGVLFVAQLIARRLGRPLFAPRFPVLLRWRVDRNLVAGAALFGVGWGLSGFCPGPALVSAGGGASGAMVFLAAMISGMALVRLFAVEAVQTDESWGLTETATMPIGE
jgi:uncharacterized protein